MEINFIEEENKRCCFKHIHVKTESFQNSTEEFELLEKLFISVSGFCKISLAF